MTASLSSPNWPYLRWEGSLNGELCHGEYLLAHFTEGKCDLPSAMGNDDRLISAQWRIAPISDFDRTLAQGDVTFTKWDTVKEERKAAKRIAKSLLKTMDDAWSLEVSG